MTASPGGLTAACSCGKVALETRGEPITATICYCKSCQVGSRRMEALPGGRPAAGPDGGTACVIYRKDRVETVRGTKLMQDFRLEEDSRTRRVVAGCCGSPLFLDFEKGHWLTVYRAALGEAAPLPEMRIQTRSRPEGLGLPDDGLPGYPGYPPRFIAKLLAARIRMLLRR